MKTKITFFLCTVVLLLIITKCQKENDQIFPQESSVEFGFTINNSDLSETASLKSSVNNAENASFIILSIEDANGNTVKSMEKLELFNFNGEMLSEPVSLPTGKYKLTKFLVSDANNNILFASPIKGSGKESIVKNPLPLKFVIRKDKVLKLIPEVISTNSCSPYDFGYSTFSFEVVDSITSNFLLSVFEYNDSIEELVLTEADLILANNSSALLSISLQAKTNSVQIPAGYSDYQLFIKKPGYITYMKTFSLNMLQEYCNDPLKIILKKEHYGLVLWNTLGSEQEVIHSKVGHGFNYPLRSQVFFDSLGPSGFGNCLRTEGGTTGHTGGFLEIDHNDFLPPDKTKGSIEVWVKKFFPWPIPFQTGLINIFGRVPYGGGYRSIQCAFADNYLYLPGGGIHGGLFFNIVDGDNNSHTATDSSFYTECSVNTWYHMAFVWDFNGIEGTSDIIRIYRDNILVSSNHDIITNKSLYPSNEIFKVLGHHQYPRLGYSLAVIDNIKVWNYAKTDYSDRFNE